MDSELYQGLLAAADQGLIVYDNELRYRFWNRFMEQLTGYPAAEVLGRRNVEVFPFLREAGVESGLMRALRGDSVQLEDVFLRLPRTGREIWQSARYSPRRDAGGRLSGLTAVITDVSELRRYQGALARTTGPATAAPNPVPAIVGSSPALRQVLARVALVAPTRSSVLLLGETGTGKELLARAIHRGSPRHEQPFVAVNCGALSPELVESEFFGHVRGAFSGAVERRQGRFEAADGGTLFLDEVAELSLDAQAVLLRVLQDGELNPVGSNRTRRVDVRVIAATNQDLTTRARDGRFRTDLFYRLAVFTIQVPPLRERREDIPDLVRAIAIRRAEALGKEVLEVDDSVLERLARHRWPGNVRELENVIERALLVSPTRGQLELDAEDRRLDRIEPRDGGFATLLGVQRSHIIAVLEHTHGVIEGAKGAAAILGLRPSTLRSRMRKLAIRRSSE
jgi:PAS domain S-box-containing protein